MKKLIYLLLVISCTATAQDLLEKSHDISRKAKKGYLGQVVTNADKGTFDMIFIYKSTSKNKIKTETYTFDKNLVQIGNTQDEIELEKARLKWKWFKYKGDLYKYNMSSASANLKGDLVFRKKEITGNWNWWWGQYDNEVKVKEKVKPTDADGNKYGFFGGHYDNPETQSMLLMAINRTDAKSKNATNAFDIVSVDENFKIEKQDQLRFDASYMPIFSQPIQAKVIDELTDWIVLLAPVDKDNQPNKPTSLIYIRISPEGKVKENVPFTCQTNGFRVLSAMENEDVVTLIGTGVEKNKDDKYFQKVLGSTVSASTLTEAEQAMSVDNSGIGSKVGGLLMGGQAMGMLNKFSSAETMIPTQELLDKGLNEKNYDHFVIGEFRNGKYNPLTYANVDDFKAVHQKPSDQKKFYDWDGKTFSIDKVNRKEDGTIYITGQDFKNVNEFKSYKEAYCFKIDQSGALKASFGVDVEQKNTSGFFSKKGLKSDYIPVTSKLISSKDQLKTYWFMFKVKKIHESSESDYNGFTGNLTITSTSTPLRSIQYSSIDNATNTMSDRKDLGDDEKRDFYLFNKHNQIGLGQYTIFLSETERGDKILLSRFDTSK